MIINKVWRCTFIVYSFVFIFTVIISENQSSSLLPSETSLCSHLCGPWPWMALTLLLILSHVILMKTQLVQPHQPDLSQSPNGSFRHSKQREQWLSLHKIWSLALSFVCMYRWAFDTCLFCPNHSYACSYFPYMTACWQPMWQGAGVAQNQTNQKIILIFFLVCKSCV